MKIYKTAKKSLLMADFLAYSRVSTDNSSPVSIHFLVIFGVFPSCDPIHPFLVVKIPSYGLFYSLLEL